MELFAGKGNAGTEWRLGPSNVIISVNVISYVIRKNLSHHRSAGRCVGQFDWDYCSGGGMDFCGNGGFAFLAQYC